MDEIKSELKEIRECQIRIESDIKHHIDRTDRLQNMTEPMYKAFIGTKWSIGAILTLGFLITAIAKIKGIL